MKKLQILGTGCAKCTALAANTEAAAEELGVAYELEKVTDLKEIMAFGVMTTPALVVDGVVKVAGRVPAPKDIKAWLVCLALLFGVSSFSLAAEDTNTVAAMKLLPKLLDLGATKCIPCKKMAPILEELKKEYTGRMEVEFIDVWKDESAAKKYGISLIPTQIFFDASGKELFRHEGFYAKADILAKWRELGVKLADAK